MVCLSRYGHGDPIFYVCERARAQQWVDNQFLMKNWRVYLRWRRLWENSLTVCRTRKTHTMSNNNGLDEEKEIPIPKIIWTKERSRGSQLLFLFNCQLNKHFKRRRRALFPSAIIAVVVPLCRCPRRRKKGYFLAACECKCVSRNAAQLTFMHHHFYLLMLSTPRECSGGLNLSINQNQCFACLGSKINGIVVELKKELASFFLIYHRASSNNSTI
jgi:hypothetical protein